MRHKAEMSGMAFDDSGLDRAGHLRADHDAIGLADLSVAAQLSLLRFPSSAGSALAGRGVPGISDHPRLQSLFHWRDQLEERLLQQDPATTV